MMFLMTIMIMFLPEKFTFWPELGVSLGMSAPGTDTGTAGRHLVPSREWDDAAIQRIGKMLSDLLRGQL